MDITSRSTRTSLNVISSLLSQIIIVVCGLIVPRCLLKAFGSEVYGATTSITQFLSYIALIEGGIGGVARSELYKPLAENNKNKVALILKSIKSFFFKVGLIFIIYVVIIGVIFKDISSLESLDWTTCFFLVAVISISNLGQYFIGMTYGILLQADQKNYVINLISIATTILNTLLVILLIFLDFNIVFVKLISSCVFLLRPLIYFLYVKKYYNLPKTVEPEQDDGPVLKAKWTGLGQHIAYFVHSNTDIVLLTIILDLRIVAVYSVYALVTTNIQSLISSFGSGMEGLFGELIAKDEKENLRNIFSKYVSLLSFVSIIIFATTFILIVPFVKLYTSGIEDVNYIYPLFGFLMVLASFVYIIRLPFHNIVIAAGKFKETNAASFGEAAINIIVSITCVYFLGIVGVAIGTCAAVIFRYIYYLIYVYKNIVEEKSYNIIKMILISFISFIGMSLLGYFLLGFFELSNYLYWALAGFATVASAAAITCVIFWLFNRKDFYEFFVMIKNKFFRRKNGLLN